MSEGNEVVLRKAASAPKKLRGAQDVPEHAILPEQYADLNNRREDEDSISPERRILVAILSDALISVTNRKKWRIFSTSPRPIPVAAARSALKWIMSSDRSWFLSFLCICEELDLDPYYVRGLVHKFIKDVEKEHGFVVVETVSVTVTVTRTRTILGPNGTPWPPPKVVRVTKSKPSEVVIDVTPTEVALPTKPTLPPPPPPAPVAAPRPIEKPPVPVPVAPAPTIDIPFLRELDRAQLETEGIAALVALEAALSSIVTRANWTGVGFTLAADEKTGGHLAWIESDDRTEPESFLRICEALSLEPESVRAWVRNGVQAMKEADIEAVRAKLFRF